MSNLKPELYGEVLISGTTEKELYQAWENAKDKEESKNLIFEDVKGSRIQTMIHQNDGWSPVGRTATVASLKKRSLSSPSNAIESCKRRIVTRCLLVLYRRSLWDKQEIQM